MSVAMTTAAATDHMQLVTDGRILLCPLWEDTILSSYLSNYLYIMLVIIRTRIPERLNLGK